MTSSFLGFVVVIAAGWLVVILFLSADKSRLLATLRGRRTRDRRPMPVRDDTVARIPASPAPGLAQPPDQPPVPPVDDDDDPHDEDGEQEATQDETPATVFSVDLGLRDGVPASTRSMAHVSVRIYARVEPGRGDRGDLVIERRTVTPPDEAAGESYEALKDAAAEALVEAVLDPTWPTVTEFWVTPVGDNIASLAEGLQADADAFHDLLIGQPIESVGSAVGIPALPLTVASAVGVKLPLPGDPTIKTTKLVLLSIGIIAFSLAGAPLIANACLKVLIHDQVTQILTTAVKHGLSAVGTISEGPEQQARADTEQQARADTHQVDSHYDYDPISGRWTSLGPSSELEAPLVGSDPDLEETEVEVALTPRVFRLHRPGASLSKKDSEVTPEDVFGPERTYTTEYGTGTDAEAGM